MPPNLKLVRGCPSTPWSSKQTQQVPALLDVTGMDRAPIPRCGLAHLAKPRATEPHVFLFADGRASNPQCSPGT